MPPDPSDAALGAALRRRRTAAGLLQADVGSAVGMDGAVYGRIEAGARPCRVSELRAIAAALGVDPGVLLTEATPWTVDQVTDAARARFARAADAVRDAVDGAAELTEALAGAGEACGVDDVAERITRHQAALDPHAAEVVALAIRHVLEQSEGGSGEGSPFG